MVSGPSDAGFSLVRVSGATFHATVPSPIGSLLLVGDGDALSGLYMQEGPRPFRPRGDWTPASEPFAAVRAQLDEYFAGARTAFEIVLAPRGTPFQMSVWEQLRAIPYGETISYGELAGRLGEGPAAARAVGLANGCNPISVIVPCHRVIGADGGLTGFGGGIDRKRHLLDLERGIATLDFG
jgi:methylated-DNA-[protein]-cysteine S-methyltransferase